METTLYLPVKRFLENLGFAVKGEVGGCDLVALSGGDPPVVVIGELKLTFNLELVTRRNVHGWSPNTTSARAIQPSAAARARRS